MKKWRTDVEMEFRVLFEELRYVHTLLYLYCTM